MDHPQGVLRTGDRATVQFEFISHPEFIKVGMRLLFREGRTKVGQAREATGSIFTYGPSQGLGVVTRIM